MAIRFYHPDLIIP